MSESESFSTGAGELGEGVDDQDMDNENSVGNLDSVDSVAVSSNSEELNDDDSDYNSMQTGGGLGNLKGRFPHSDLQRVKDGLYKFPSWTVNLRELVSCTRYAAFYCKPGSRLASKKDIEGVNLLIDTLPEALNHCLNDAAIHRWREEHIDNIFCSCLYTIKMTCYKLGEMRSVLPGDEVDEDLERCTFTLLSVVAWMFDVGSEFTYKTRNFTGLPYGVSPITSEYSEPTKGAHRHFRSNTSSADGSWDADESPSEVGLWISHLINCFGGLGGFQFIKELLEEPASLKISQIVCLLVPVYNASSILVKSALEDYASVCRVLLEHISLCLDSNMDRLSDDGKDRGFMLVSRILRAIYFILAKLDGPAAADAVVGDVQRKFVVSLLNMSNFNTHLTAVREANAILKRAMYVRSKDNGASVKVNVAWLRESDVINILLRNNLHQKQYVDQVQMVLKNLTVEGGLQESHLEHLWTLTEKVDTFEVVKNNVYAMLGDLAMDFTEAQLDSLFHKFQGCTDLPLADTMKILALMRRLAAADNEGHMAQRVLTLLWNLVMEPGAPVEVVKSGALQEALKAYCSHGSFLTDYMMRCVEHIKGDKNSHAALITLRKLLVSFPTEDRPEIPPAALPSQESLLTMLETKYALSEAVLSRLEAFIVSQRSEESIDWKQHMDIVDELLNSLCIMCTVTSRLTWDKAERLWTCLVENPAPDGPPENDDRAIGLRFFIKAVNKAALVLEPAVKKQLLLEKITHMPPGGLSEKAWQCFDVFFLEVNHADGCLQHGAHNESLTRNINLSGLEYLWQVVLDAPIAIAKHAMIRLGRLYSALSPELEGEIINIRRSCISNCTTHLRLAAGVLLGEGYTAGSTLAAAGGSDPSIYTTAAQRAARCLEVLQRLSQECQSRMMPTHPTHAASFQGMKITVNASASTMKPASNSKFSVEVYSNSYVGYLRKVIANHMKCSPAKLRLFVGGKEMSSDSQLLTKDLVSATALTVMVNSSNMENAYSLPTREAAEASVAKLPSTLLSQEANFHDLLLSLADGCSSSEVRGNAISLLGALPTYQVTLDALRAALNHSNPIPHLSALLFNVLPDGRCCVQRARLLYTIQALTSLLFPLVLDPSQPAELSSTDEATEALREKFIQTGCVCTVLQALCAVAFSPTEEDVAAARSLNTMVHLLVSRVLLSLKPAPVSDVQSASAMEMNSPAMAESVKMEQAQPSSPPSVALGGGVDLSETGMVGGSADSLPGLVPAPTPASSPTNPAVLSAESPMLLDIMDFLVRFATNASHSWGMATSTASMAADDEVLNEHDAMLAMTAMESLLDLLTRNPALMDSFLSGQTPKEMVLANLLNYRHLELRQKTLKAMQALSQSPAARQWLLGVCISALGAADALPFHCREFYMLLCDLVSSTTTPQEMEVAEGLLTSLVESPSGLDACRTSDSRLEGKLRLTAGLVNRLAKYQIGAKEHGGLVKRLLSDFLFPEAYAERAYALGRISITALQTATQCPCSQGQCRLAALELLRDLMFHHTGNLREGCDLISYLHLHDGMVQELCRHWEFTPRQNLRSPSGFVGLKNAGATCYLNAVCQQLFMQPSIRRLLLSSRETLCDPKDSVLYQLQVLFGHLALSEAEFFEPRDFWAAFKDYDGEPISLNEHQDAYEFFTRLQDLVDQHLRDLKQTPVMQSAIGGKFTQQIICRSVDYKSEKDEDFYQVSLDVRGKKNLEESLDFYVQGELMEGDNAYFCEDLGCKVDAVKRNCFRVLPHTLVIHLKRFEWDYETMTRWKIKDRFEFPLELDMFKYTAEGQAEADAAANPVEGAAPVARPHEQSHYSYQLKGIVVHSGSAFAGHYYSYIKARKAGEGETQFGKPGDWYCFDDQNVESWDISQLDVECFGGSIKGADSSPKTTSWQSDCRPNSAYMLFYERSDDLEPVSSVPMQISPPPFSPLQAETPSSEPTPMVADDLVVPDVGDLPAIDPLAIDAPVPQEPQPVLPYNLPSKIFEDVVLSNIRLVKDLHLFDGEYFTLIRSIVAESIHLCSHKMRRTDPPRSSSSIGSGGSAIGGGELSDASPSNSGSSRVRRNDIDKIANSITRLSFHFLFRVYLHAHLKNTSESNKWRRELTTLLDSNPSAAHLMVDLLHQNQNIFEIFARSPVGDDVWTFIGSMVSLIVKNGFHHEDEDGGVGIKIRAIVEPLARYLHERDLLVHQHKQIYGVPVLLILLEYAGSGPQQRSHLHQLGVLTDLLQIASYCYPRMGDMSLLGFNAMNRLLSVMFRRLDLSNVVPLSEEPDADLVAMPNPYYQEDDFGDRLDKETYASPALRDLVYILTSETAVKVQENLDLLKFLCWNNNGDISVKALDSIVKDQLGKGNCDPSSIRAIADFIALGDAVTPQRINYVLCKPRGSHGICLLDIMSNTAIQKIPNRRYQLLRLVTLLFEASPRSFQMSDTLSERLRQTLEEGAGWIDKNKVQWGGIQNTPENLSFLKELEETSRVLHMIVSLAR